MLRKVSLFIDWDTARRIVPRALNKKFRMSDIDKAVESVMKFVASYLYKHHKEDSCLVRWRIYHGWYMGKTKTEDRRRFESFVADFRSKRINNTAFNNDFKYGDELLCSTRRNPLYDTLRERDGGGQEQKMVDTAIACDLLHTVKYKEAHTCIVFGDDDDLLPALFTAEAWKGDVVMLTCREDVNKHLKLDRIVAQLGRI